LNAGAARAGRGQAGGGSCRPDSTGVEMRIALVDAAASLDRPFTGVAAVIKCAGQLDHTTPSLIVAALRAGIHYLDVSGETLVAISTFDTYRDDRRVKEAASW